MALLANHSYFVKIITVDRQGNQTISAQQAVTSDGVHNADMGSDLVQNFRAHAGLAITLPAGATGNQILKYSVTDWISGSGGYTSTTGLFTAGAAGKFLFSAQAEINGLAVPTGLSMRLALKQNGTLAWFGPNAAGVLDSGNPGFTTYSLCASLAGSLNLAASDTVGLWLYWTGLTGDSVIASPNCFFEGRMLPG